MVGIPSVQLHFSDMTLAYLYLIVYVIICCLMVESKMIIYLFIFNWQLSHWTLDGIVAVQEPCNLLLYLIYYTMSGGR